MEFLFIELYTGAAAGMMLLFSLEFVNLFLGFQKHHKETIDLSQG